MALHRVCVEHDALNGAPVRASDGVAVFFASAIRDPAGERRGQTGGLLNYGLETCPVRLVRA